MVYLVIPLNCSHLTTLDEPRAIWRDAVDGRNYERPDLTRHVGISLLA